MEGGGWPPSMESKCWFACPSACQSAASAPQLVLLHASFSLRSSLEMTVLFGEHEHKRGPSLGHRMLIFPHPISPIAHSAHPAQLFAFQIYQLHHHALLLRPPKVLCRLRLFRLLGRLPLRSDQGQATAVQAEPEGLRGRSRPSLPLRLGGRGCRPPFLVVRPPTRSHSPLDRWD